MNFSFSILLMIQRLAARICCDWKEIKRRTFNSVSFPGKTVQLYIDQDLWQDSSKKWGRARRLRWEVGRRKKSGSLSWLMEADTFTRFFNSRFSLRTPTRRHRNVPDQNLNGNYLRNCDDGKSHLLIFSFFLMFCPAAWILPRIVRIENPSWVSAILMELSIGCFDRAVNAESPPKYSFCLPPPTHRIFTFEPIQILEW